MRILRILPAVAGALMACAPASAALVTKTFLFTVTGAPGPVPNQSGSFTFQFDNSGAPNPVLLAIDYTLGSTSFSLANAGVQSGSLYWYIGGTVSGITGLSAGAADDFLLQFSKSTYSAAPFLYFKAGAGGGIQTADSTMVQVVEAPVPEPAVWTMMLAGFGAVGHALRRRGRMNRALAQPA